MGLEFAKSSGPMKSKEVLQQDVADCVSKNECVVHDLFSPPRNWFTIFDVCIAKMLVKEHKFVGVELDKWPSFHSFIPCVAYEPHSCSAEK